MTEPTWPHRRELYIDARDLQSDGDPDHPLAPEEYAAALASRGLEKLASTSWCAPSPPCAYPRPHLCLRVDFFLGDTITVSDERLGVTVDAVVQGARRTAGRRGTAHPHPGLRTAHPGRHPETKGREMIWHSMTAFSTPFSTRKPGNLTGNMNPELLRTISARSSAPGVRLPNPDSMRVRLEEVRRWLGPDTCLYRAIG